MTIVSRNTPIQIFALSLFLYDFGFVLKDQIYFSFPMMLFYIFVYINLIKNNFHPKIFLISTLVLFSIFIIALSRTLLQDFAPAFILFSSGFLVMSINFEKIKDLAEPFLIELCRLLNFFSSVILIYVFASLYINFEDLPLSTLIASESAGTFLHYFRPKLFFLEPAHLALFLSCGFYASLILYKNRKISAFCPIVTALSIFFIGSLAGYVVSILFAISYSKRSLPLLLGVVLGGILLFLSDIDFARKQEIMSVFTEGNSGSSSGQRLYTFLVIKDFLLGTDVITLLSGAGFSDYSGYFYDMYKYNSALASGKIPNSLAIFLVSIGLPLTLISIFIFLYSCARVNLPLLPFLAVVAIIFSYGTFVNYFFWSLLMIVMVGSLNGKISSDQGPSKRI